MSNFKYFIGIASILALVSCSTNSELGMKIDKFFQSKRYKETLKSRDDLFAETLRLKNDTTKLGTFVRNLQTEIWKLSKEHSTLKTEYKDFSEKTEKQLAQLNEELKAKSNELDEKGKMLTEREYRLKEMEKIVSKQDSVTRELNNIVKNALLGFNADELSVEMKNGEIFVSMTDKLLFKSGSAAVEEKGKEAIKKLAGVLNRNTDIDISIEGHTDSIPIKTKLYKDNWDLSVARSTNIVRMLHEYKVDPTRLTASGKGEYFPVASNKDPEERAKNRRTDIVLSPRLDELYKILQKDREISIMGIDTLKAQ